MTTERALGAIAMTRLRFASQHYENIFRNDIHFIRLEIPRRIGIGGGGGGREMISAYRAGHRGARPRSDFVRY